MDGVSVSFDAILRRFRWLLMLMRSHTPAVFVNTFFGVSFHAVTPHGIWLTMILMFVLFVGLGLFLLVQHGDQLLPLTGCSPNILDSAKESDLSGLFLFV